MITSGDHPERRFRVQDGWLVTNGGRRACNSFYNPYNNG